jgi:hypothetical protein
MPSNQAGELLYREWAPSGDPWSPWVKPSLFATITSTGPPLPWEEWQRIDTFWARAMMSQTAIVVDLPGIESLHTALALAREGYRPVPLYNTSPGEPRPALDVKSLVNALSAPVLDSVKAVIGRGGPPVFVLDSLRAKQDRKPDPGTFDNRWVVFPQDFPSGNLLHSRGITRVILIQAEGQQPQEDLAHVLLRWQESGLQILVQRRGTAENPQEIKVQRPSRFRALRYRAMVMMGLRRNSAGGFGAVTPMATTGSGFS